MTSTTDVRAAGSKVGSVAFPEAAKVVNVYPIVAVEKAPNPDAAEAFVAFVTGPDGQRVLADAGFGKP